MAQKRFPDEGKILLVNLMTGKSAQEDFLLKLFTNNVTPADTDTGATYTEMTGQGYVAKTLAQASWGVAAMNALKAEANYAEQSFVFSAGGPATIYGHYIIGATSGTLISVVKWDAARTVQNANDTIKITPNLGADDEVA